MSDQMPKQGTFCWNELVTKDCDAAGKFYSELIGWEPVASDTTGHPYILWKNNGSDAGGMMQITEHMGDIPSHWMAYITVDDVDGSAKKAEQLGGKIICPPMDIPEVGRFTIIADPTGAKVGLIKLTPPE